MTSKFSVSNPINDIFSNLDKWRNFPNYQLERRADIFFSIYLKEIIAKKTQNNIFSIIPEFPIRVGTLHKNSNYVNKSYKIDYIAFPDSKDFIYLIELKTDASSVRDKQIDYLEAVKNIGLEMIIEDSLKKIIEKTSQEYKSKYDVLINELISNKILDKNRKYIDNNLKFQILYILPVFNDIINKRIIRDQVITFDDIIKTLNHHSDPLTKRFIQSLNEWKNPPNIKPE